MFGNYKVFSSGVVVSSDHKPVRTSIFRQPSPLDSFLVERIDHADGVERVFITTDLSVFFNQQRLMSLNPMAMQYIVNSVRKGAPDLNMTDDQLMGAIKSRYIQSNADVWSYARAVENDIQAAVSDYQAEVAKQQAQKVEQQQTGQQVQASDSSNQ